MKAYKHVLFDFDGVLCDSLSAAIEGFEAIRQEPDFAALPLVTQKEDLCIVYEGALATSLHKWLSPQDSKRFFDLHSSYMANRCRTLMPFRGVGAMLTSLGCCSIVTSAYSDVVRYVLAKDPAYDNKCIFRIAGRELGQPKNKKISTILSDLGLSSAEAIYVGDLESDILYCRDVPIDIVSVTYGYHPLEYLESCHPTYLVKSVDELQRLLLELAPNEACVR